eukprot:358513-Chlamydomonas_euryale.AAC.5
MLRRKRCPPPLASSLGTAQVRDSPCTLIRPHASRLQLAQQVSNWLQLPARRRETDKRMRSSGSFEFAIMQPGTAHNLRASASLAWTFDLGGRHGRAAGYLLTHNSQSGQLPPIKGSRGHGAFVPRLRGGGAPHSPRGQGRLLVSKPCTRGGDARPPVTPRVAGVLCSTQHRRPQPHPQPCHAPSPNAEQLRQRHRSSSPPGPAAPRITKISCARRGASADTTRRPAFPYAAPPTAAATFTRRRQFRNRSNAPVLQAIRRTLPTRPAPAHAAGAPRRAARHARARSGGSSPRGDSNGDCSCSRGRGVGQLPRCPFGQHAMNTASRRPRREHGHSAGVQAAIGSRASTLYSRFKRGRKGSGTWGAVGGCIGGGEAGKKPLFKAGARLGGALTQGLGRFPDVGAREGPDAGARKTPDTLRDGPRGGWEEG